MKSENLFEVKLVSYDRFNNRITTIITNKDLAGDIRDEIAKRKGTANLKTAQHGKFITHNVIRENKKGYKFKTTIFDLAGNQIELATKYV